MESLPAIESQGKLLDNVLLFGRLCKLLGIAITPTSMVEVAQAIDLIELVP